MDFSNGDAGDAGDSDAVPAMEQHDDSAKGEHDKRAGGAGGLVGVGVGYGA